MYNSDQRLYSAAAVPGVPVSPRESLMLSRVDVELCPDQLAPLSPRESLMPSCVDVELCPDHSPWESLMLTCIDDQLCPDPGVHVSPR